MKIKVRLFATLREGRDKEVFLKYHQGMTPSEIMVLLNIAVEDVAILLINGRDGQLDTQLLESDYVSIFPPVGGG